MSRPHSVWGLFNSSCQEMTRIASESLDHDPGLLERIALRLHVLYCKACRRYLRQVTLLKNALRGLSARIEDDQLLPEIILPDDVRERIQKVLKEP